jgi:hypothetical protein
MVNVIRLTTSGCRLLICYISESGVEFSEAGVETVTHGRSHRDLRRTSYQDIIPTLTSTAATSRDIKKTKRKRRRSSTSSSPEDESGSDFSPGVESDEDDDGFASGQEGKSPLIEDEDLITDDMDEKTPTEQSDQVVAIQDDGKEALFQVLCYIHYTVYVIYSMLINNYH